VGIFGAETVVRKHAGRTERRFAIVALDLYGLSEGHRTWRGGGMHRNPDG